MTLSLYMTDALAQYQNHFTQYRAVMSSDGQYPDPDVVALPITEMAAASIENNTSAYNATLGLGPPPNFLDDTKYTEILISVKRYGYGYGMNAITMRLAAAVLLLHVLVAVIHTAIVVYNGWHSNAWGSLGDVIALALSSKPAEQFHGASAGMTTKEVWDETVRVRKKPGDRMELVMGADEDVDSGLVQPGKAYGG